MAASVGSALGGAGNGWGDGAVGINVSRPFIFILQQKKRILSYSAVSGSVSGSVLGSGSGSG